MPVVISAKGKRFLNMYSQAQRFQGTIAAHEAAAAAAATDASRSRFLSQLSGRPSGPSRAGRLSTGGTFGTDILWSRGTGGSIEFDLARLPFYALIQEIGTGQQASMKAGAPGGARTVASIDVPSQYGREISANLYWGSGPGGQASRAQAGRRDQQLYYASELNAKSVAMLSRRKKRIRREIKGKHFIAVGSETGFVELATRLTDEARRIFR